MNLTPSPNAEAHPSAAQLHAFLDQALSAAAARQVQQHLEHCARCQVEHQHNVKLQDELFAALEPLRGDRHELHSKVSENNALKVLPPAELTAPAALQSATRQPATRRREGISFAIPWALAASLLAVWTLTMIWNGGSKTQPLQEVKVVALVGTGARRSSVEANREVNPGDQSQTSKGNAASGETGIRRGDTLTAPVVVSTDAAQSPETLLEISLGDHTLVRLAPQSEVRLAKTSQASRVLLESSGESARQNEVLSGRVWLSSLVHRSPSSNLVAGNSQLRPQRWLIGKTQLELLYGECLIDRTRGDRVSCREGKLILKRGEAEWTLASGQVINIGSKGGDFVEEEYFPWLSHGWMRPLIDPQRTPAEFRRWYRELLLALGESKGSSLAAEAVLQFGVQGRSILLDYISNNRLLRRGVNRTHGINLLAQLYGVGKLKQPRATEGEVEQLFSLLQVTRGESCSNIASALQGASGVPSPIPLQRWAQPTKRKEGLRSEVNRWRKQWEQQRQLGEP